MIGRDALLNNPDVTYFFHWEFVDELFKYSGLAMTSYVDSVTEHGKARLFSATFEARSCYE